MVHPKKHLGQHFLRDENIARKIISSVLTTHGNIIEIGPGTGILTKYILENKNWNSFFFEIDSESVGYLEEKYPEIRSRLFREDFLGSDLGKIPAPFTVIGNFPYNISSQILFKILDDRSRVPEVVGMFQKEVAERIASKPGSKKYGILSVLLQAFYNIEYLFTVNESVFFPPPKVKSAVIRFIRNNTKQLDCDEELFYRVVKMAFNQRRKTLRNALKPLNMNATMNLPWHFDLEELLGKRAEQLSVQDFVGLTKSINQ